MGTVQIFRSQAQPQQGVEWAPFVNVEVIRFRYTPARGFVYGVPAAAKPSVPLPGTNPPGPLRIAVDAERAFLNPRAGWAGTPSNDLVEPSDTYAQHRFRAINSPRTTDEPLPLTEHARVCHRESQGLSAGISDALYAVASRTQVEAALCAARQGEQRAAHLRSLLHLFSHCRHPDHTDWSQYLDFVASHQTASTSGGGTALHSGRIVRRRVPAFPLQAVL